MKLYLFPLLIGLLALVGCTEESRNELFRSADNLLGKDLRVSYIDEGQVVKSWTVRGGKITSGKTEQGVPVGYYFFWTDETGYVQLPIDRTVIEEIRSEDLDLVRDTTSARFRGQFKEILMKEIDEAIHDTLNQSVMEVKRAEMQKLIQEELQEELNRLGIRNPKK